MVRRQGLRATATVAVECLCEGAVSVEERGRRSVVISEREQTRVRGCARMDMAVAERASTATSRTTRKAALNDTCCVCTSFCVPLRSIMQPGGVKSKKKKAKQKAATAAAGAQPRLSPVEPTRMGSAAGVRVFTPPRSLRADALMARCPVSVIEASVTLAFKHLQALRRNDRPHGRER
jgi:hypothetical protein